MPQRRRRNPYTTARRHTVTREQYYEGKRSIDGAKLVKLPTLALEDMDYPRVDPVAAGNLAWAVFDDL